MKQHTRWKRVYPSIIGKRFFDGGEFGIGFFMVLKAWKCKEYSNCAITPDGSRWFSKELILIKTDAGIKYKIPFCPWLKIEDAVTGELWSKEYDSNPW